MLPNPAIMRTTINDCLIFNLNFYKLKNEFIQETISKSCLYIF